LAGSNARLISHAFARQILCRDGCNKHLTLRAAIAPSPNGAAVDAQKVTKITINKLLFDRSLGEATLHRQIGQAGSNLFSGWSSAWDGMLCRAIVAARIDRSGTPPFSDHGSRLR
jgi:hypothetical protein